MKTQPTTTGVQTSLATDFFFSDLRPDECLELRVLDGRRTHIGYFDDPAKMAAAASKLTSKTGNAYITLNPCPKDLMARTGANLVRQAEKGEATADKDIVRRRLLLIDCDPARPSKIASSEAERQKAKELAETVADSLHKAGWGWPLLADSGNGFHLLYRIDLPNTDDAKHLVARVLEAVKHRWETKAVKIDTTVSNAARISRFYGTRNRKGFGDEARPHRPSSIIDNPPGQEMKRLTREQLETFVGKMPSSPPASLNNDCFDLPQWIADRLPDATGPEPYEGGSKWVLDVCPWDSAHTNRSAFVIQFSSGAIAAGCHHDGCKGKKWEDLRASLDPDYAARSSNFNNAAKHQGVKTQDALPATPQPETSTQQWEPPLPIETSPVRPTFPIDAFPAVLSVYARQVAESIQVPIDLVALDILSVLGAVLQKRVDLDAGKGAKFPLNIWTLSVYPSGGGKSRALTEVSYPLMEWEQRLQDKVAQANDASKAERVRLEQLIEELSTTRNRTKDQDTELRGLRGQLKDVDETPLPDIYSSDLTQEALLNALGQNDEAHAVLNAEASDFFQIMAGRYAKEGQSSFGFFVSAYSQELIKVKRVINGNKSLSKPTLTMGLSIQPSVFEKVASNQDFVTRGLPARFLMSYPRDMRGERDIDPPAIDEGARRDYNAMVRSLTRIEPSRDERKQFVAYQVSLKMEARQALLAFRRWAEESMSHGGCFSEVGKEFASRMTEHLAKVTGILHCATHPEQPWDVCVDTATVEAAGKIVRWSADHVLMTFGLGRTAEVMTRAAYLYERISAHREWLQDGGFSVRALQQVVKRKDRYKAGGVDALERDLSFLENLGYVQRLEMPKGGSKSAIYKLSPFFQENGPQGPHPRANSSRVRVSPVDNGKPQWSTTTFTGPQYSSAAPDLGTLGSSGDDGRPQCKPICDKGLNGTGDIGDQNARNQKDCPMSPEPDLGLDTLAGQLF